MMWDRHASIFIVLVIGWRTFRSRPAYHCCHFREKETRLFFLTLILFATKIHMPRFYFIHHFNARSLFIIKPSWILSFAIIASEKKGLIKERHVFFSLNLSFDLMCKSNFPNIWNFNRSKKVFHTSSYCFIMLLRIFIDFWQLPNIDLQHKN